MNNKNNIEFAQMEKYFTFDAFWYWRWSPPTPASRAQCRWWWGCSAICNWPLICWKRLHRGDWCWTRCSWLYKLNIGHAYISFPTDTISMSYIFVRFRMMCPWVLWTHLCLTPFLHLSLARIKEKKDPRVVNNEITLIDWSSTLTNYLETDSERFRVMVKRSAIPA